MLGLARLAVLSAFVTTSLAGALGCAGGAGAPAAPASPTAPVAPGTATGVQPGTGSAAAGDPAATAAVAGGACSADGFCWLDPQVEAASLTSVWVSDPGDAWAAGPRGALLRWDGARWSPFATGFSGRIRAVWGAAPDDVWAVGEVILHFDGTRWQQVRAAPAGHAWHAVHGSGPRDVWAVGSGALASHFDGATWSDATLPFLPGADAANVDAVDVFVAAPGEAWAIGSGHSSVVRLHAGSWAPVAGILAGALNGIWGSGPGDVWIAGSPLDEAGTRVGHQLHHWDGTAWTASDVAGAESIAWSDVGGSAPNDVWLVAEAMDAAPDRAHFDGVRWATSRVGAPATAIDLARGSGFAVGHAGAISAVAGGAWRVERAGNEDLRSDVAARGGVAWFSRVDAAASRLVRYEAGQARAVAELARDVVYAVAPVGPNEVWAATYSSGLARWDGAAWTAAVGGIAGPVAGVWASGAADVWALRGADVVHWDGKTATRHALDAKYLERAWGSAPDDVWAVGDLGSAQHWDGAAWTKVPLPPDALTLDVWGRSPSDVWIAGYDGLALHFDGAAWTRVPTGTHETLNRVTGDASGRVWLVGESGTVLEWDGAAFRALDSGTFGSLQGAAWDPTLGLVIAGDEGALRRDD